MFSNQITVATGLIKPKTTALFFDKLWVPKNSEYFGIEIPENLSMVNEFDEYSEIYRKHCIYSDIYWGAFYRNSRVESFSELFPPNTIGRIKDEIIYSENRNNALMQITYNFNMDYNMNITPIFINSDLFLNGLKNCSCKELDNENSEGYKELQRKLKTGEYTTEGFKAEYRKYYEDKDKKREELLEQKTNAIEICIKNLPYALEEQLEWKQVIDLKKDEKSVKSLNRLKYWLNTQFIGKTSNEVIDTLQKEMDDYSFALKKHGILTTLGSISTIVSASSTIIEMLVNNPANIISTGLAISAGIITFSANEISEYIETRRMPIAFLYNLQKI